MNHQVLFVTNLARASEGSLGASAVGLGQAKSYTYSFPMYRRPQLCRVLRCHCLYGLPGVRARGFYSRGILSVLVILSAMKLMIQHVEDVTKDGKQLLSQIASCQRSLQNQLLAHRALLPGVMVGLKLPCVNTL